MKLSRVLLLVGVVSGALVYDAHTAQVTPAPNAAMPAAPAAPAPADPNAQPAAAPAAPAAPVDPNAPAATPAAAPAPAAQPIVIPPPIPHDMLDEKDSGDFGAGNDHRKQMLKDSDKLLDQLDSLLQTRAEAVLHNAVNEHRHIDEDLDKFYQEVGSTLGKAHIIADKATVYVERALAATAQPGALPPISHEELQLLKVTITGFKQKSDDVRAQQKGIDALEDGMRSEIKKISDKINDLAKTVADATKSRPDILYSTDDAHADSIFSTIQQAVTTLTVEVNNLESTNAKSITSQAEKIRKEISSVDDGARVLKEQAELIHKTIEDFAQRELKAAAHAEKKISSEITTVMKEDVALHLNKELASGAAMPAATPVKAAPSLIVTLLVLPFKIVAWIINATLDFIHTVIASFKAAEAARKPVVDVPPHVEKQLAQAATAGMAATASMPAPAMMPTSPAASAMPQLAPQAMAAQTPAPAQSAPTSTVLGQAQTTAGPRQSLSDQAADAVAGIIIKVQDLFAQFFPSQPKSHEKKEVAAEVVPTSAAQANGPAQPAPAAQAMPMSSAPAAAMPSAPAMPAGSGMPMPDASAAAQPAPVAPQGMPMPSAPAPAMPAAPMPMPTAPAQGMPMPATPAPGMP